MKFCELKLALSVAISMTVMKIIKKLLWMFMPYKMPMFKGAMMKGKAACTACPYAGFCLKILMVFVVTFVVTYFAAWLYNKMCAKK